MVTDKSLAGLARKKLLDRQIIAKEAVYSQRNRCLGEVQEERNVTTIFNCFILQRLNK